MKFSKKAVLLCAVLLGALIVIAALALYQNTSEDSVSDSDNSEQQFEAEQLIIDNIEVPTIEESLAQYDTPEEKFANLIDNGFAKFEFQQYDEAIEYFLFASDIEGLDSENRYYALYAAFNTAGLAQDSEVQADIRKLIPDAAFEKLNTPTDDQGASDG